MSTHTEVQKRDQIVERNPGADTVAGYAVLGCLAAGTVGICKALNMDSGIDVLLCLLGSVAAFGLVFYIYLRGE
jgi:hypothetical protein